MAPFNLYKVIDRSTEAREGLKYYHVLREGESASIKLQEFLVFSTSHRIPPIEQYYVT